jgi:flagellar biosynthesis/type III secretory pathway protein FliH
MLAEPDFKKNFTNEVIEALPKNNTIEANMQKAIFTGMLESSFIDKIQQFNQKFDEQEVKTEEHIIEGAKEVFKKAYTAAKALGYNQAIERLTVAQLLTDKIMQKCSPVALEPETYAQFANGYVLKNASELLKDVEAIQAENEDMFKDNEREITFQKAGKAYDDMNREKLEIIDVNVPVNEQVVPPVQSAPSIKATSIDKK